MESRKIVYRETGMIAIGQAIGLAVMWAVFALMGYFDRTVLLGGIIGAVIAILNFFFMAMMASLAADKAEQQDVKGGTAMVKTSYMTRMIVIFIVLFACLKSGMCNAIACVLPLAFVRPTITIAEFFRKKEEG